MNTVQCQGRLFIGPEYPYGILWNDARAEACYTMAGHQLPFIRADWFLAQAARPPLYHEILQLPRTERELQKQLHIDVRQNIHQERVARAGFNGSGVSRNNRLIERHSSPYGVYWRSYDFANNSGRHNIFAFPLGPARDNAGFRADGGEVIFSLPNRLFAFLIVDANGVRLDKAPLAIVSDPKRPDRAVVNGVSCMSCHARGLIPKDDQVRTNVLNNPRSFSASEREAILALYPSRQTLGAVFKKDNVDYRKALEFVAGTPGVAQPLSTVATRFEQELDLASAAAELGYRPVEFSTRLGKSALMRTLGPLRVRGGTVQRQVFEEALPMLVREFRLGRLVR